jgi:hypothetical protein
MVRTGFVPSHSFKHSPPTKNPLTALRMDLDNVAVRRGIILAVEGGGERDGSLFCDEPCHRESFALSCRCFSLRALDGLGRISLYPASWRGSPLAQDDHDPSGGHHPRLKEQSRDSAPFGRPTGPTLRIGLHPCAITFTDLGKNLGGVMSHKKIERTKELDRKRRRREKSLKLRAKEQTAAAKRK